MTTELYHVYPYTAPEWARQLLNIPTHYVMKYYVHPETIAFFKARAEDGVQPYYEIGVEKAREASIAASTKYGQVIDFNGTDNEIIVPSPYDKAGIPVSVYKPASCNDEVAPTILVYFHGGGNTIGCRKTHESICKILARDTPCIMVNVEYRLAPEHKFPANHDDAKCVMEWMAANKTAVGGGANSKLGVSGDSAGARLAAVVCHEANNIIDFAVLVYPSVSYNTRYPSLDEFSNGPVLSKPVREWFTQQYLNDDSDKANPRASVILHEDFSYLPPTLILVADLDPLRDGCYVYYEKLKAAGVKVELKTVKGVPHAFWSITGAFKETGKEAQNAAIQFIRKFKQ